jgi:acyl carrier protein
MDHAGLAAVIKAKAAGAAHLHELTQDLDLDAFVLYSSMSGVWGGGGQGGYAAANACLDALACLRRSRGLAATSIAWGLWAGEGMGQGDGGERMQQRGLRTMAPSLAITAMPQAVAESQACLAVVDVDWSRFAPSYMWARQWPLLNEIPEAHEALETASTGPDGDTADGPPDVARRLASLPEGERHPFLLEVVRSEAAAALGYASADDVQPGRAFRDLGFDSLTAVELRNRLTVATGLRLPATLVFDYPTPTVLADHLRAGILQENPVGALSIFEELDRFEAALSSVAADEEIRNDLTERLRGMVSRFNDSRDSSRDVVIRRLQSASPDEVMDFIDNELN